MSEGYINQSINQSINQPTNQPTNQQNLYDFGFQNSEEATDWCRTPQGSASAPDYLQESLVVFFQWFPTSVPTKARSGTRSIPAAPR